MGDKMKLAKKIGYGAAVSIIMLLPSIASANDDNTENTAIQELESVILDPSLQTKVLNSATMVQARNICLAAVKALNDAGSLNGANVDKLNSDCSISNFHAVGFAMGLSSEQSDTMKAFANGATQNLSKIELAHHKKSN